MNRPEIASLNDAMSKLLDATNSFHEDDEFRSKFKAPSVEYAKFTPENLIKKMALIERDSTICAREVRFLIKFYLHLTSNSRLGLTSEGYLEFEKLMKKYNVDRKARGDNITLHRIAASFPIVSVSLLRQFKMERKFTTEMLRNKNAGEFPWCMRTQMCLSLVPSGAPHINDLDTRKIIFGIVAYMYYENQSVNDCRKLRATVFETVLNIAHAVYKESSVAEDKKKHAWNHVLFDYEANKASVDALWTKFRSEIPGAEAVLENRFGFITQNNFEQTGKAKGKNSKNVSKRFAN